jgi:hypothetical protein
MNVTKPHRFLGFGAMDVTKPYRFIWFGAEPTQGLLMEATAHNATRHAADRSSRSEARDTTYPKHCAASPRKSAPKVPYILFLRCRPVFADLSALNTAQGIGEKPSEKVGGFAPAFSEGFPRFPAPF